MYLTLESYRAWETLGIEEGLKAVKEAGFDGVDFSFYWKAATDLCGEDYRENAQRIKAALEKYGLVCNQAHAPFDYLYGMPQDESCFEDLSIRRAIEMCGIIGIDHIVVHGILVPEGAVSKASLEYNYRYYKSFEPLCEKFGVKIAVENLSGAFTYPDLWNAMLEKLDSPWFIGLVDVGHAWLRAGIQPGEFIRRLKPGALKGLHIQDTHGKEQLKDEHLVPGMGSVDYDALLLALKETGYSGDFTMEIPGFLKFYNNAEQLRPALAFAAAIGRGLVNRLETM